MSRSTWASTVGRNEIRPFRSCLTPDAHGLLPFPRHSHPSITDRFFPATPYSTTPAPTGYYQARHIRPHQAPTGYYQARHIRPHRHPPLTYIHHLSQNTKHPHHTPQHYILHHTPTCLLYSSNPASEPSTFYLSTHPIFL